MINFEAPSFSSIIKSIIIAIVLGLIGYFLFPSLPIDQLSEPRLFSYALLIGGIIGGILVNTHFSIKTSSSKVESIFVGNLAFKASARALRELFEDYGEVHAVRLMTDRQTKRPRGYGFVEMNARDAKQAIAALDGSEFYGRELKVNVANARKSD
ncbi:MAG: RNA-binding protein [Gammaproteobacteria bacterium]|jgi:hypothetical protein